MRIGRTGTLSDITPFMTGKRGSFRVVFSRKMSGPEFALVSVDSLPAHYSPYSFRATGITNFSENDGTLEAAQRIAGHADSRTTKLYDRRGQKVLLEDMERIWY